ncbi:MAG TPA: DNA (cytosine-5-)-methyltransferase [Leeuwenhoekiella sp.]|nr:DNA (cytosine-5-)-methyltransferase [Leeuwenhoekiella sp.]
MEITEFKALREKAGLTPNDASEKFEVNTRTIYRWDNGECRPHPLALKYLKEMISKANSTTLNKEDFKYIDLFAGIGGFRKAFDSIGGKCVFTSEWDKYCRTTYQANFESDHIVEGDIRQFTNDPESLSKIPKHDLLVAGFPCQPFSIAGVSKKNAMGRPHGFKCDTQGTLFFDLAQIIEFHQPKAILLENVKNLVSHDKGKTFKVIKRTLEKELGYNIQFRIIDAKGFVPQHRERIFIVGFKNNTDFNFDDLEIPSSNEGPRLNSILHSSLEQDELPFYENGKVGDKYTLTPRLWEYLQEYKAKHRAKGNGFGFTLSGKNDVSRTLSARYYKDGSEILIEQGKERPRRLTPRECSRLMGFDSSNESKWKIPVSDTQAYKQFGNSVAVPVATAVAKFIKPYIVETENKSKKIVQNLPIEKSKELSTI